MATITVLKFKTPQGAEETLDLVKGLTKQQLINLHDAAIVTWPEGKKKPKTKQLTDLAGVGALDGAFWGMLFGLIFFVPFFGMAVGAAMGALSGKFSDYGIDDDFIKSAQAQITEGTSALFILVRKATGDKVLDRLKQKGFKGKVLQTSLTVDKEEELRKVLEG